MTNEIVKSLSLDKILTDVEMLEREGEHFNQDHYQLIISEDLDIYKPDGSILLRFRKNVIGKNYTEPAMESFDPKGRKVYWVGPVGAEQDAGEGTDFHAIRKNYVSITPIQIDLTRHNSLESLSQWIEVLN